MTYYGDINPGDILNFAFTTVKATGVPTSLLGTPALKVIKNVGLATSVEGVTLVVNPNLDTAGAIAGLNFVTIDTSADGAFYSGNSSYDIIISAGTVDSLSVVGYKIGAFSIMSRSALRPTTPGNTLDVSELGRAGIDWGNIENPTALVALPNTLIGGVETVTNIVTIGAYAQGQDPASLILAAIIEGTITFQQAQKLQIAANGGKLNGATRGEASTINIRDSADSKNRVVATVDANGNRTAVTLNLT